MTRTIGRAAARRLLAACAVAALSLAAGVAHADVSTATLGGAVTEDGRVAAGASITAVQLETGFSARATADGQGRYVIPGLRPGTYRVTAVAPDGHQTVETVIVQVGQTATVDLAVASTAVREVTVIGRPRTATEVRTSEVATNVTQQQIEDLPQASRNFLNFAQLAPGVRLSTNPVRQTFSGGANGSPNGNSLESSQTNVYIDGVSYKSNVQQGGIVGQDSTRGNPFNQDAVQEMRVETQNFKAEYADIGTAGITTVTRSGTNEFHGDAFVYYQNQDLRDKSYSEIQGHLPKQKSQYEDYGAALGGPIIKDKLFFFFSYEANDQQKYGAVVEQGSPQQQADLQSVLGNVNKYLGTMDSPFHEDQYFGKLTWQVAPNNTLDLSFHYRDEHEITGFGGQGSGVNVSLQQAQNNINQDSTWLLKDIWRGDHWLNEGMISLLTSDFNPAIVNANQPGQQFNGVLTIGGYGTEQKASERDLTFKDDFTYYGVDWHGSHVFKTGFSAAFDHYFVNDGQDVNPQFFYTDTPNNGLNDTFGAPYQATFSTSAPSISANDTQFGVYLQDDWTVNRHLTLNLGVRWDYESNMDDNDFVTPAAGIAALQTLQQALNGQTGQFFNINDYITNGHQRHPYMGEIQPRIGGSYDVFGDHRTVFFAGFGRYYDRTLFRNAAEEKMNTENVLHNFYFSPNGGVVNGIQTLQWNPNYLSAAGLRQLINSSQAVPSNDLRLLANNQRPPYTDQFDIGIRQKIWIFNTSVTFSKQNGYDEIGYFRANRNLNFVNNSLGGIGVGPQYCCIDLSSNAVRTRYTAIYVKVDKPWTRESGWGLGIAYTNAHSKQNGNPGDFNYDFPNIGKTPFFANDADVHNQFIANWTVSLPWEMRTSGLFTLTSGQPYQVLNALCSNGYVSPSCFLAIGDFKHAPGFAQLDLNLVKTLTFWDRQKVDVRLDVFNVFNKTNYGCQDGFEGYNNGPNGAGGTPVPNTNFTHASCQIGTPRQLQLGLRYAF